MRSPKGYSLLCLLFAAFALVPACSSSPTAGHDDLAGLESGAESGADAVGSIPEDMLAQEEAASDNDLALAQTNDTPVDAPTDAPTADPFSDLAENTATPPAEENTAATNTDDLATLTAEENSSSSGTADASGTSGATDTYTVKAGDTLMKIAFTIYGDIDRWKDLKEWNASKVKSVGQLQVGSQLTYETPNQPFNVDERGHSYVIKSGDTLAGIADEVYGRKMKFRKLQRYNESLIKNADRIFAGFTIFYDITSQEMAEAEARRQERMAGGQGGAGNSSSLPSAVNLPQETKPQQSAPLAVSPSNSAPIAPPASASAQ